MRSVVSRIARLALRATLGVAALLVVLLLLIFGGLETGFGQSLLRDSIVHFGGIGLDALHGSPLRRTVLSGVVLRDDEGPWLRIERVTLAWNPLALAQRALRVETLEVEGAALLRLPQGDDDAAPSEPATESMAWQLPISVDIASLRVADARIAAALTASEADTLVDGEARVTLDRALRGQGSLTLALSGNGDGRVVLQWQRAETITAQLEITEPERGFAARLAGLPALGALAVTATVDGAAEDAALQARLTVGTGISVEASGRLDTVGADNDLRIIARADSAALSALLDDAAQVQDAHATLELTGALADPAVEGRVTIGSASGAGVTLETLVADLVTRPGPTGRLIEATLRAGGVAPPAPVTPLGAVRVDATALLQPDGTLAVQQLRLENTLVALAGEGRMLASGEATGEARVSVGSLAALLPGQGIDGAIAATLRAEADGAIALDATLDDVEGPGPAAALLGPRAHLAAALRVGETLLLERFRLDGQAIGVSASGEMDETISLQAVLDLPVLAALAPQLHGHAQMRVSASGPRDDPSVTVAIDAPRIGVDALPVGALTLNAEVRNALTAPDVMLNAQGDLAGEKLDMTARLLPQPDGSLNLPEASAGFGEARLTASGTVLPDGRPDITAALNVPALAPIGRLLGQTLAGAVTVDAQLTPEADGVAATLRATGTALRLPGAAIGSASVQARADDALGAPVIDATITASDVVAGGITTAARLTARGGLDDLALALVLDGLDHRLRTEARLALPGTLRLASLAATWRGESVTLSAPATITLAPELAVDRLALALGRGGSIEARGSAGETLDLTLAIRRLPLALASLVAPDLAPTGTLEATARITGSSAAPQGQARLAVRGAGLAGTPRADVDADITLADNAARIAATLRSGPSVRLTLAATTPLDNPRAADGTLSGTIGLDIADAFLAPQGRQLRGRLAVDLRAQSGVLGGGIRVEQARFSDAALGFRLEGITGGVTAEGEVLRVGLAAQAGVGRLMLDGTIAPLVPGMPVDLRLVATDARLAARALLSARFAADMRLGGGLTDALALTGKLDVTRADIRIPDRLPANVVALDVRVLGEPEPVEEPPAAVLPISLDLVVDAPRAVFLRGQGLEAELGGRLSITGTAADPRITGGLAMRNGTLQRLGQSFTFRRGSVDFDGQAGITPRLDFEAAHRAGDILALVNVSGTPDAPAIGVSSEPELPSDEVLSRILFGRQQSGLTPTQLVQLATAAAELSGLSTPGGGVIDSIRQRLGLDRLSAGSADGGGGEVEAGSYIADGVYVGARQRTDGSTQATIQLEVLPGVRLEADIGGESSDRVGASIGFEY